MTKELTITMLTFAAHLRDVLGENFTALILFGSAVLGDFTPGKGDLDFLAAVRQELSEDSCECLFALHDRMRAGELGTLATQLEGTYYPSAILCDPLHAQAYGCYIGTGRKGWRRVNTFQNSMMDFAIIRRYGLVCDGKDLKPLIYDPSREELLHEIHRQLTELLARQDVTPSIDFALAIFQWGARALCYAHTGELLSKSRAADWYAAEFPGERWSSMLKHIRSFRYPLTEQERAQIDPAICRELFVFLSHLATQLPPIEK